MKHELIALALIPLLFIMPMASAESRFIVLASEDPDILFIQTDTLNSFERFTTPLTHEGVTTEISAIKIWLDKNSRVIPAGTYSALLTASGIQPVPIELHHADMTIVHNDYRNDDGVVIKVGVTVSGESQDAPSQIFPPNTIQYHLGGDGDIGVFNVIITDSHWNDIQNALLEKSLSPSEVVPDSPEDAYDMLIEFTTQFDTEGNEIVIADEGETPPVAEEESYELTVSHFQDSITIDGYGEQGSDCWIGEYRDFDITTIACSGVNTWPKIIGQVSEGRMIGHITSAYDGKYFRTVILWEASP